MKFSFEVKLVLMACTSFLASIYNLPSHQIHLFLILDPVFLPSILFLLNTFFYLVILSILGHLRLGHPNSHSMKIVLDHCKIPFSSKDVSTFLTACCMVKAHRLHSPSSPTTYNKHLELVFSDLWGPLPILLLLVLNTISPLLMPIPVLLGFTY